MKFKKLILTVIAVLAVSVPMSMSAYAENDVVTVMGDNETVEFDQNPVIIEGHTLVPVRAVFEKAGAEVMWVQPTQTATISRGDYVVTIKYGESVMYKNGTAIALEQPADVINNRTMIPVRAIAEAMDFSVTWDGHHSLILVSTSGKPYRAYAYLKLGFKTLEDASEFYCDGSALTEIDLDGDGKAEVVEFAKSDDMFSNPEPVLEINGIDYTAGLGSMTSVYSMAVVDINTKDDTKEIVVVENGDTLTARFYRYNNGILKPVVKDNVPSTVSFASKLLFSGTGYIISDLTGACFTDIMVTGCIYKLEDEGVSLYRMSTIESLFGRNLYKTYNDSMLYNIIYTKSYQKGSYKDMTDVGIINATDITEFKLIDGYRDYDDPKYIELYIELPNGEKAVITPYMS